jgi:proteasome lid subunit RPN8/RPN11
MFLFPIAAPAPAPDLIHEPVVLSFCRSLLEKAVEEAHREQGAFVVRTPDGLLYFVMWPPSEEKNRVRWYGRFPDGTVAMVHTHAPHRREPSELDLAAARRTGVPVYVLTAGRVVKTDGQTTRVLMEGEW